MGVLLSLSKSSALVCLDISEWALFGFGLLLVLGLIVEYRAVHGTRWMKFGEMLVIIGVAGELVADGGIFLCSGHLQTIADQEIARLNLKAARFEKDAADLQARNLQLEEQILEQGPRDLLLYGKREEDFLNSIRQFAGQKVQIRICQSIDEVRDTADRLTVLFGEAGWTVSPHSPEWGESNCGFVGPNEPAASGVWVGMPNLHPTPTTRERSGELIRYLSEIPLATKAHLVGIETVRANKSKQWISTYGDADSIVVIVLEHPSKGTGVRNPTPLSPFAIGP
jgi:hypothetical protein